MNSQAENWVRLYQKVNEMMLSLAINGLVHIDEQEPNEVMDAMNEIDGGEWQTGMDADDFKESLRVELEDLE